MKLTPKLLPRSAVAACLLATLPSALGQSTTVTYVLDDVWLLPDITSPGQSPRPMTGAFEWTYDPGDFENGAGRFLEVSLPWYGTDLSGLNVTFDLNSIEFTLAGNFHGLGVDVTLRLLDDLAPDQPVSIDTAGSMFDIEVGVSHRGHVISGSIVPVLNQFAFCGGAGAACPCGNAGSPGEGCMNSTGGGSRIDAIGTASVLADDLAFTATGLPPGALSLLLSGTGAANAGAGTVLGDGLLCVGGSIVRVRVGIADAAGALTLGTGIAAHGGLAAGDTRYFQCWHRDAQPSLCGSGVNLTGGLAVTFTP